ncbi:cobalt ECF transporter T component CbiQ [Thermotalea metallivorans]|uniref:Cobalt transport protein CbiQ n=1 Tax=Thermotalea metallivorans TaxID=520762 RepID=A0A140L4F6_9FIRM|nr:cobalt ECF transporter T component CbiQ [Thermotalea metallivorans]KXG75431.1 Cobalt transport protein CbiQ [Thermotalea metallivorans]
MISMDQYAYINRLKSVHPMEKCLLSGGMLLICLWNTSPLVHFGAIALMTFLVIAVAGIPGKTYVQYLLLPLVFLITGVGGVALTITKNSTLFLYGFAMGHWKIGISQQGLDQAVLVFLRAYASVTCLYFLAFTTPMTDMMWVLRKLRMPTVLVELAMMIYRFIFVLMETASMIYISQDCRLGYSSIKRSYTSLGQLASNLFVKAFCRAQELFTALTARGYTGRLDVLEENYYLSMKNMALIVLAQGIFMILALQ